MTDLFPEPDRPMKPWHTSRNPEQLARRGDPAQSKGAAAQAAPTLGKVQRELVELIAANPDKTVNELADIAGIRDPRRYGRRTNELVAAGRIVEACVRECSVTGRNAGTWRVVG